MRSVLSDLKTKQHIITMCLESGKLSGSLRDLSHLYLMKESYDSHLNSMVINNILDVIILSMLPETPELSNIFYKGITA